MIVEYNLFIESKSERLSLKKNMFLLDNGYQVDYEIYIGNHHIGGCSIESIFKEADFDDSVDSPSYCKNIEFNYRSPVKKSYYNNIRHILYLSDFEISEQFRRKGHGLRSIMMIIKSLNKIFPNHDGIYLDVFKSNTQAVNIYKKCGFLIIKDDHGAYRMKYNFRKA